MDSDYQDHWDELIRQDKLKRQERKKQEAIFYQEVGRWLKKHRQARGWSENTMALKCNISKSQIYTYERGTTPVPLVRLYRMCKMLNIAFPCGAGVWLSPEEKRLLTLIRCRDYKSLLLWILNEM